MTADISGPYREHQEQPFAVCAQCVHVAEMGERPTRWRCTALSVLGPEKVDPLTGKRSRLRTGARWCVKTNPDGACVSFEKAPPEVQPPPPPEARWIDGAPTPRGPALLVVSAIVLAVAAGITLSAPADQAPASESPR